ncbi:MAG: preprotein translocase subunit SecG [Dehalococcoidia bacterium]|jgi:preprotein translocase subunit SecG|nr:preprotein translocase subunit SecG [Dehalococcoidia bacterium]|tara:strand:+ start:51 stop:299 length:249 start_codon:yes stop_codon:yes gene_type:complete
MDGRRLSAEETMNDFMNLIQLLVSILLVVVILAQVNEGGGGLFGSASSTIRTRRGLEKTLFQFTIFLAIVFVVISIISVRVG